jgi:asparagine synthase (glutamine-hydrolysing)
MPGVCGIIGQAASAESSSTARRMLDCMIEGGAQHFGLYSETRLNCAVGWVTEPGSFSDRLPIWNETRDLCLFFLGEAFVDCSEMETLKSRGHSFNRTDASWLVHLYEDKGLEALQTLNGFFSGLLVDLRKRETVLFNDRYGLGRIYYHEGTDGLLFSSQAKSLLKALPHLRQLDSRGLVEWFTCGCALQNRTLFHDISLLPGASAWVFSADGHLVKRRYFDPASWETQPELSSQDYYARLEKTFPRVLRRYFHTDRAVAMSLTGGVDGRMIMAWSPKHPGELPCYTFNGPNRDCADVEIARRVAKACGQTHQTIAVGDQFFSEFPALAEKTVYLTDGAMDVTGAAELYVNQIARQIAPIRMTGNYGSEVLRSNVAFKPADLSTDIFDPALVSQAHEAAAVYADERRGRPLSFIAFKQVPWHHYGRLAIEQSQLTVRSPFLDNEIVALAFRAPAETVQSPKFLLRLIAEGNRTLGRIPTDRGLTYPSSSPITRIRKAWAEFLAKAEYAFDYGMPQWLARIDRISSPLRLERLFLGRQKFCHFRTWYRDQFARYVKEIILDSRTRSRPYLNGRLLESMVSAHLNGSRNFTIPIHQILSMELVHRLLIERA